MTAFVTKAAEDAMTEAFLAEFERRGARLAEATGLVREMLPFVGLCLRARRAGPASDIDAMNDLMSRAGGVLAADSADDDPYRRAAQQSLDARREGMARARADGTAERAVDDLLKILGK
jgi:hypothetical protein